jgi:uncharacterized membrane protein
MIFTHFIDWLALGWFFVLWVGYGRYARRMTRDGRSLTACLYRYRIDWMRNMMGHANRIPDVALLGNLANMVNFLATTTLLILAGIVTMLSSTEKLLSVLDDHTFIVPASREEVQFKLLLLTVIFMHAFFRLTWSMRQHTFCNIIMGSLPELKEGESLTERHLEMAQYAAKISDRAGNEFNDGLRCYYFALAALTWFLGTWPFAVMTALVVGILYRREFRSTTLKYLQIGLQLRDGAAPIQKS